MSCVGKQRRENIIKSRTAYKKHAVFQHKTYQPFHMKHIIVTKLDNLLTYDIANKNYIICVQEYHIEYGRMVATLPCSYCDVTSGTWQPGKHRGLHRRQLRYYRRMRRSDAKLYTETDISGELNCGDRSS